MVGQKRMAGGKVEKSVVGRSMKRLNRESSAPQDELTDAQILEFLNDPRHACNLEPQSHVHDSRLERLVSILCGTFRYTLYVLLSFLL